MTLFKSVTKHVLDVRGILREKKRLPAYVCLCFEKSISLILGFNVEKYCKDKIGNIWRG